MATLETRLQRLESDVTVLTWMAGANLVLSLVVLWRVLTLKM